MPRPRFTLRVVLIGVTLFALFVGLTQWRNRYIRGEVESLARSGCEVFTRVDASDALEVPGVGLSEGWIDGIWQRGPNRGNIMATDLGNDSLRLGQELVSRDEFEMKLLSQQRRLESLGVERIFVLIDGQAPYSPPAWIMDFRRRSDMIIYWGDTGSHTYGPGNETLVDPPL